MTIGEFNEYIRKQPLQTYIVEIKLKYQYEKEYRYTNEILRVENGCDYVWLNDWHEGEEDVEILNCVALNDIDLSLQWIPCSERLPEIGKEVLLSEPNNMFLAEYYGDGNPEGVWHIDYIDRIHHYLQDIKGCAWMPLPELYKGCNYE